MQDVGVALSPKFDSPLEEGHSMLVLAGFNEPGYAQLLNLVADVFQLLGEHHQ